MPETENSLARFHLTSPKDLFYCLENALAQYQKSKAKRVEDLFFLIMGLTHLREWIAPGYDYNQTQTTTAHALYHDIYATEEFKTIQALCNGLKHLKHAPRTSYSAGLPIDEWPAPIDAVVKWDDGPPTAFYVDGEDVENILQRLVDSYREKWFSEQSPE